MIISILDDLHESLKCALKELLSVLLLNTFLWHACEQFIVCGVIIVRAYSRCIYIFPFACRMR